MTTFEYAKDMFRTYYDVELTEEARKVIDRKCDEYGTDEVEEAIYIVCERYDDKVTAFQKIGGVLEMRRRNRNKYFK